MSSAVADVGAAHPENHILGDVGRVIGDSLQVARNQSTSRSCLGFFGVLLHGCTRATNASSFMRSTTLSISSTASATSALAEKRLQRAPDHGRTS